MKKIAFITVLTLPILYATAATVQPATSIHRTTSNSPITSIDMPSSVNLASPVQLDDTTFTYNDKKVIISDDARALNVSVYRLTEEGDSVKSQKVYEGIFTDSTSVERRYENSFEISIPDIFKPKKDRRPSRSRWAGIGLGFIYLPEGFDSGGELTSITNLSRSGQYNLNFIDGTWRIGNSNLSFICGMGLQFNNIHWQNNKAIEVDDYRSVITTTEPGEEYRRSKLHYTYLTYPLLFETNWHIGQGSYLFVNAGMVAKIKIASSSKIWWNDENGRKLKTKLPGELNLRPITLDFIVQAGIGDFGFFASYSPFSLFREGKGPKGNQATLGVQFYF